jgi:hypothetical protein
MLHHNRLRPQRGRWRHRSVIIPAVAVVIAVVLALSFWAPCVPASVDSRDSEWPGWGFTHTQFSGDVGYPPAVASVEAGIAQVPMVQAQHIMGFGADNPEPAPGVYDFASLDRRMDFIRSTGASPVIVLCCAPDWMKGGQPGETDWDRLEVAPDPEHFSDFAALSALIAQRYSYVRYFLVWNEFKGFFDDEEKRWNAEQYTDLYNGVYDALKAVNPANKVGGPYLDFAQPYDASYGSAVLRGPWGAVDQRVLDAFTYWKTHHRGADFVVVDGHATTESGAPDAFAALTKFSAVSAWLKRQVNLPIWWAEWYVEPDSPVDPPGRSVALRVAAMIELASAGAQTVLYWNPRPEQASCAACLWTDTWLADGGRPLPFLIDILQRFARSFPPRVERHKIRTADGLVALASDSALVVVNTTDRTIASTVDGQWIELPSYAIRWVAKRP